MFNLYQIIQGAQGGQAIDNLARQFGLSRDQADAAVKSLIPALSTGFMTKGATPGGYGDILGAMGDDHHRQAYADAGVAQDPATQQKGGEVLGSLFGSGIANQVAEQASRFTGIPAATLVQMLPVIASMVIGGVTTAMHNQGMGGLLGQLATMAQQGGLGSIFGQFAGAGPAAGTAPAGGPAGNGLGGIFGSILGSVFGGAAPGAGTAAGGVPPAALRKRSRRPRAMSAESLASSRCFSPGVTISAARRPAARPKTTRSMSEFEPRRFAPWTETQAASPSAIRPGTMLSGSPPTLVSTSP